MLLGTYLNVKICRYPYWLLDLLFKKVNSDIWPVACGIFIDLFNFKKKPGFRYSINVCAEHKELAQFDNLAILIKKIRWRHLLLLVLYMRNYYIIRNTILKHAFMLQFSTEELVKEVENSIAEFKKHNQEYDEERVKEQVSNVHKIYL